jgi:Flp pilus assembly protein TadB
MSKNTKHGAHHLPPLPKHQSSGHPVPAKPETKHAAVKAAEPAEHKPKEAGKGLGAFFKRKPVAENPVIVPKKQVRKRLHRKSLEEYLEKAGYETDAERLKTRIRNATLILFGIATASLIVFGIYQGATFLNILIFLAGLWAVVYPATLLLIWAVIYFFLDYRIYKRTKELEEVLPDFLQLASSNIAAGMPIDRALWYAIRPNFGILAKEMEEVAKSTMAGEDLEASLIRFTKRYDSTVLKRSINILVEGLQAGGEMADLLNKIALNIDEMKIMKKEMAASVTTYAIFIMFASVAIAPILFALATELLTIIIKITGSLDLSSTSSMLTLSAPDPRAVENFRMFSIAMIIVSTIFSASIVSVIRRGNIMEGIKSIPVYTLVALTIYFVAQSALHSMMGGII